MTLISTLTGLPVTISCAESTNALPPAGHSALLHPGASAKRQAEFAAGRTLIGELTEQLGYGRRVLGRRTNGSPDWPEGLAGSISHCPGYRIAVLARSTVHSDLGVDAEPLKQLQPETFTFISTSRERAQVDLLRHRSPQFPWCRLLFTAKEAAYKACTSTGHRPTWTQLRIDLGYGGTTLTAAVDLAPARLRFGGCWAVRSGHYGPVVRTVVWTQPLDDPPPSPSGEHAAEVAR